MSIQYTEDLSQFVFRKDNREKIRECRIELLCKSLKQNNMLKYKPIQVNEKMEIIDGQHRVIAAKRLNLGIYYQIIEDSKPIDILTMHLAQTPWSLSDIFNFWCHQGKNDYLLLKEYLKKHNININTYLKISGNRSKEHIFKFKNGEFKYFEPLSDEKFGYLHLTIDLIKKLTSENGTWLKSGTFYSALSNFFNHPEFDINNWVSKLRLRIYKIHACANKKDYLKMILDIYNYRLVKSRIDFDNSNDEEE